MHRRSFIGAVGLLVAAPAIVRFHSIMPVRKVMIMDGKCAVAPPWFDEYETQMWNKLMKFDRALERMGWPISKNVLEAMRTRTLPPGLQRRPIIHAAQGEGLSRSQPG